MTIIATEDGSLGVACGENHEVLATEWELHSFLTKPKYIAIPLAVCR